MIGYFCDYNRYLILSSDNMQIFKTIVKVTFFISLT